MSDIEALAEQRRLTEHNILGKNLIGPLYVLQTIEPYEVDDAMSVAEVPDDATLSPLPFHLEAKDLPPHLYVRHVGRQLVGVIETTAVYVLRGVILDEVAIGRYAHTIAQLLCPRRTDVGQIGNGIVKYVRGHETIIGQWSKVNGQ